MVERVAADRVKEIVAEAAELAAGEREAFLLRRCGGDERLLGEVRSLLSAMGEADAAGFFASPTADYAAPAAAITEGPGTMVGRYKILQLIGEGGFGSVFMAEQTTPVTRRVALKIIKLGMDTRAVIARFEAERQALAMMEHPHIARVLDAGATETGRPYFVMELVKGEPITTYADREKLTIGERLELFLQVCSAIQHAHLKGIIHRDLKPGNILVSTQDGKPFAKVIDFGIAKATAARLTDKTLFTEFRQFVGTPQYMSPEQADGSLDIDTRTDVYSLGVLLYELLTGSTPFDATKLRSAAFDEMRRIIREEDPQKPSTRLSHGTPTLATVAASRRTAPQKLGVAVRGELDWIVMKALEKDRARRFASAADLGEDLKRYMAGETVVAAPPTAMYRLRKFASKYRAAMATATAIAGVLVAGIVVSAWQALRAHRAEQTVMLQLTEVEQQRHEAQNQRDQAVEANKRAEEQTAKVARMAASHCADQGLRAETEGDPALALLWFARAVKLDGADEGAAAIDRRRFAVAYRQIPQPVDAVPCDVPNGVRNGLALSWGDRLELLDGRTHQPVPGRSVLYDGAVNAAQFSPDGKYIIAACTEDRQARLYETATGRMVCPPMPHDYNGYIDFTPDGQRIVTQDGDRIVLRTVPGGKVGGPTLPSGWCRFSKDGSIAIIHHGDVARVWNTVTGEPVGPELHPTSYRVAMSSDGKRVGTTGTECRVWDSETGEAIGVPMAQPVANWCVMEFSPDGKRVLTGANGTWRLWDAETGEPRTAAFEQAGTAFWGTFSPDGTRIATMSYGRDPCIVMVRDTQTGKPVCGPICTQAERTGFTADNRELVTVPWFGGDVEVWDVRAVNPVGPVLSVGGGCVNAAFMRDGSAIAALARTQPVMVRTWDMKTGEAVAPPIVVPNPFRPKTLEFTEDGGRIKVEGVTLDVYASGPAKEAEALPAGAPKVLTLARSEDGALIVGADVERHIRIWDARTHEARSEVLATWSKWPQYVRARFSSKGKYVAIASALDVKGDLEVHRAKTQVWEVGSGREVAIASEYFCSLRDGQRPPTFLEFSADEGALLVVDYYGEKIWLWDMETAKSQLTRTIDPRGDSAHFFWEGMPIANSVDGKRFLVDSNAKPTHLEPLASLHVWEVDMGADRLKPTILGSRLQINAKITGGAFSADGRLIATAGADGTQLWDARTGQAVAVNLVVPEDERAKGADFEMFSPDTNQLATASGEELTLWDISFVNANADQLDIIARFMADRALSDDQIMDSSAGGDAAAPLMGELVEPMKSRPSLRASLIEQLPGLFRTRQMAEPNEMGVSATYRQVLETRIAAAEDDAARQRLSDDLAFSGIWEAYGGNSGHALVLAEAAVKLNDQSIAAQDALAMAYLAVGRSQDALEVCRRCAGKRAHFETIDQLFGVGVYSLIRDYRSAGREDPHFAEMESLLVPTFAAEKNKGFLGGMLDAALRPAATQPEK